MPTISVIVPIYGVEQYIGRCARSLFAQTLDDIEFIFIDDCTPDRSVELLEAEIENNRSRIAGKNWVVRIVRIPVNSGQAAVRKYGIQLATGDYIIHCDSDDWVDATAYEKMYKMAQRDGCDIVVCDYSLSDGISSQNIKYLSAPCYEDKAYYWRKLLRGEASTSVWSKLVKRELYLNESLQFPQGNMWEDFVLSTQLVSLARKIGYLEECLYFYYYNPLSICNTNIDRNQKQIMENAGLILSFVKSPINRQSYSEDDIICFKVYARYELSKYVSSYKYWRMWHDTFPEIKLKYLFLKDVSVRQKLRFLLQYIGLYPIVSKALAVFRK